MQAYIFHHVLSGGEPLQGEPLMSEIVEIARSLPGVASGAINMKLNIEPRNGHVALKEVTTSILAISLRNPNQRLIDLAELSLDDVGEVTVFFLTTYSRETEQNPAYLSFRGEQARAIWAYFQRGDSVETLTFNE